MNLKDSYDFLLFWIDKEQGAFYTFEELDNLTHRAQLSYFNTLRMRYGTNEQARGSLSPFKTTYTFTNSTSPAGLVTMPDEFHLLDIYTVVQDEDGTTHRCPCPVVNDDERTFRFNSQVIPNTIYNPFAERIGKYGLQLYPRQAQAGVVTYLRQPVKPLYAYDTISGRVFVFAEGDSQQLEWAEDDITAILVKALSSIGINIDEQEVVQWAEMKDQFNSKPGGIKS